MNTLALAWKRAAEAWEQAAYWEVVAAQTSEISPPRLADHWRREAEELTAAARKLEEQAHV